MEMEYKDPSRRGRWIVVIGVVLAVAAGGAAFFLINQAQQPAGRRAAEGRRVVAAPDHPGAQAIEAADVDGPRDPAGRHERRRASRRHPKGHRAGAGGGRSCRARW